MQWRMVVTKVSRRRTSGEVDREGGNMNLISSWTEEALITRQVNVSELSQLMEMIGALETVEVVRQRVDLDELSMQVGVSSQCSSRPGLWWIGLTKCCLRDCITWLRRGRCR